MGVDVLPSEDIVPTVLKKAKGTVKGHGRPKASLDKEAPRRSSRKKDAA